MSFLTDTAPRASFDVADEQPTLPQGAELASMVAAKLCHDFISPSGAVMSGLDLLDDPTAQDMRDDAMGLIRQSARKMISLVSFSRVAFGSSSSAERFSSTEIHNLLSGLTDGSRAQIDWRIPEMSLAKPHARALLNLAYLTHGALALGGTAIITARQEDNGLTLVGQAEGNRVRLKPEALMGLRGQPLSEGLNGQWIQPYWLWLTISEIGGRLDTVVEEQCISLLARLPNLVEI